MATAVPIGEGDMEDNRELELSRVRENIKRTFVEFTDCLKARESELWRELDNILASYLSYRSELEKVNGKRIALDATKEFLQNQVPTSPIQSVHEEFIARVTSDLKSMETPTEPNMVTFDCDSNRMLAEFHKLGRLVREIKYWN